MGGKKLGRTLKLEMHPGRARSGLNIAAVSAREMIGSNNLIGHRRFFLTGGWIKLATTTF